MQPVKTAASKHLVRLLIASLLRYSNSIVRCEIKSAVFLDASPTDFEKAAVTVVRESLRNVPRLVYLKITFTKLIARSPTCQQDPTLRCSKVNCEFSPRTHLPILFSERKYLTSVGFLRRDASNVTKGPGRCKRFEECAPEGKASGPSRWCKGAPLKTAGRDAGRLQSPAALSEKSGAA
jgi:hypothetical protein